MMYTFYATIVAYVEDLQCRRKDSELFLPMVEVEDRDTFAACLLMPWSSMKPLGKLKLQKFIDLDVFAHFQVCSTCSRCWFGGDEPWHFWGPADGAILGSFPNRQDQEEDPACGDPSCE